MCCNLSDAVSCLGERGKKCGKEMGENKIIKKSYLEENTTLYDTIYNMPIVIWYGS
jgi:hypothetical protein